MNYWYTLTLIVGWMILFTIAGRAVASLLPKKARPLAGGFLAPAIGLGLYVLLATAVGWLVGTRPLIVIAATFVVTSACLWRERAWRAQARAFAWVAVSTILICSGLLLSVWYYGGFSVYHDAFTYIVHAQWLQEHAYRETVIPTVTQPAYTQILIYQNNGLRMGASFLFGWIHAATPFTWSIYSYPVVVCVGLAAGSQAVAGLALALYPSGRRWVPHAWAIVAGISVSGFTYGSATGFFPQTIGLALIVALLALLVVFRPPAAPFNGQIVATAPLALLFAALGYAYSELLPFMSVTLGGWFVFRITGAQTQRRWVPAATAFAIVALVLLNAECLRIVQALLLQANAVVGWAIPWSTTEFAAHALGFRSGVGDGDWWMLPADTAGPLALALGAGAVGFALFPGKNRRGWLFRWSAVFVFLAVCGVAFLYYRYAVPSPWPDGTGQSWSQFKLSNWASPVLLAVVGAIGLAGSRHRVTAAIAAVLIAAMAAGGLRGHFANLPSRMYETLRLTGRQADPFAIYEGVREAALAAQPRGLIYLELGGSDYKSRQLAAYFLHDLEVAADWSGDGYIYPRLPPGWQNVTLSNARWWVFRKGKIQHGENRVLTEGALGFAAVPPFTVSRMETIGGYGEENDATGWWRWTAQDLSVRLQVRAQFPTTVCLHFTVVAAAEPRKITVTRHANGQVHAEDVIFAEGWQEYVSAPFTLTDPNVEIALSSSATPVPLGGNDPRQVVFLAKNVRLQPVFSAP